MADNNGARIAAFLAGEYRFASIAVNSGSIDQAWFHLERAHIVAQTRLWLHCQSHWQMLKLAIRLRDWSEISGQMLRMALAPIGNVAGRLPVGNSGRANVSAFAHMEIPPDLRDILDPILD